MHKPTNVQINITGRCNLRCRHCNIWKIASLRANRRTSLFMIVRDAFARRRLAATLRKEELSYKEWVRVLTDLKGWLGPYLLIISGGEPFLRKDAVDIIRFCDENEIRTIVNTNGTLLTRENIAALSDLHTLILNISLDGSTPQTHDYLRGVSGTYQKAMDVLQQFKNPSRQCLIGIAMVLMGHNCDEILDIVKFIRERKLADGVIFQPLNPPFGIPYKKAWFHKSMLWPRGRVRDRLIDVIGELIRLKNNGAPIWNPTEQLYRFQEYFTSPGENMSCPCTSGENNFIINQLGEVFLCWKMKPVADFPKEPGQIWESACAQKRREAIRMCRQPCRFLNCNFKLLPHERQAQAIL